MTRRELVEGGKRLRTIRVGVIAVVGAFLFIAPLANGQASQVSTWSEMAAYAVAVLGLGLVTGYCGQISIGHSAFVGIGAYTTIILVADYDWPYLATIPVAVLICLGAGAIVGIPALGSQFSLACAFLIIIGVLQFKPAGLFGHRRLERV